MRLTFILCAAATCGLLPAQAVSAEWDNIAKETTSSSFAGNPANSSPAELTRCDARVYFSAFTEHRGRELYWTDGFPGEYVLDHLGKGYTEIIPGSMGSNPRHLFAVGPELFFAADRVVNGTLYSGLLHVVGESTDHTVRMIPVSDGLGLCTNVEEFTLSASGEVWFTAEGVTATYGESQRRRFTWRTPIADDGWSVTRPGLVTLQPAGTTGPDLFNSTELEAAGTKVAVAMTGFSGMTGTGGFSSGLTMDSHIFLSDGQSHQHRLDGGDAASGLDIHSLCYVEGDSILFYVAQPGLDGGDYYLYALYPYHTWPPFLQRRGEGTSASPYEPRNPTELTALNCSSSDGAALAFCGGSPLTGRELWGTQGPPETLTLIEDILPGPGSSNPKDLAPTSDDVGVFVFITDSDDPTEDGVFGAVIESLLPGSVIATCIRFDRVDNPMNLAVNESMILFGANAPLTGQEVWTLFSKREPPAGLWVDADEGHAHSQPEQFTLLPAARVVIAVGEHRDGGHEPFSFVVPIR